jgi:hypothetical protein
MESAAGPRWSPVLRLHGLLNDHRSPGYRRPVAATSTGVSTTDVLAVLSDEPQRIDLVPRGGVGLADAGRALTTPSMVNPADALRQRGPYAGPRCPSSSRKNFPRQ